MQKQDPHHLLHFDEIGLFLVLIETTFLKLTGLDEGDTNNHETSLIVASTGFAQQSQPNKYSF